MEFSDRLGWVALIMAFVGIAITILWPTKRWIGWASLGLAVVLGVVWAWIEFRPRPAKHEVGSAATPDLSGIKKSLDEINRELSKLGRPEISAAQMEAIKEVSQFIAQPDEMSLRKEFGFPEMMDKNIRAIINNLQRYKRTGINHHYAIPPGDTLVDDRFAKGHIQRKGGGFEMDMDDTTVYLIMLPKDYVSSKARLVEMINSTALSTGVIESLKNFDATIQKNATHLIEVLSAAMDKDHNLYLEYDNRNSPLVHKIDALYLDTFIQLRPEADKVRDAIRQAIAVNE
jgi:hypothetical protein